MKLQSHQLSHTRMKCEKPVHSIKDINGKAFNSIQGDPQLRAKLTLSGAAAKRQLKKQLPETKEV